MAKKENKKVYCVWDDLVKDHIFFDSEDEVADLVVGDPDRYKPGDYDLDHITTDRHARTAIHGSKWTLGVNPEVDAYIYSHRNDLYAPGEREYPEASTAFGGNSIYSIEPVKQETDASSGDSANQPTKFQAVYSLANLPDTKERRKWLEHTKDTDEFNSQWLSGYYSYINGEGMSNTQKYFYDKEYEDTGLNEEGRRQNSRFDPYNIEIVQRRVLKKIVGENAVKQYIQDLQIPEDSGIQQIEDWSNATLVAQARRQQAVREVLDEIIDHYMAKYYADVEEQYVWDPVSVGDDIKAHSIINDVKKAIDTQSMSTGKRLGMTILTKIAGFAESAIQFTNWISGEGGDYDNEQRDRAEAMLNYISEKKVKKILNSVGDLNPANEEHKEKIKELTGFDEEQFDKEVGEMYAYYKTRNQLGYTPQKKLEAHIRLAVESQYFGQQVAGKRFIDKLADDAEADQSTIEKMWNSMVVQPTCTTVGTVCSILNFAYHVNPFTMTRGTWGAITDEGNFWDNLGNHVDQGLGDMLDNSFINWANNLETTHAFDSEKQEYLKNLGIQDNPILRPHDKENTFWNINTVYDAIPVVGYAVASYYASYGIGFLSKLLSGTSKFMKGARIAARMNKALNTGTKARLWSIASGTSLRTAQILDKASKVLGASNAIITTAGMDMGYAKSTYDEIVGDAERFVYNYNEKGRAGYTDQFLEMASKKADSELSRFQGSADARKKAKEDLVKKYADDYINYAKKSGRWSAGVTFGLTILPDIHLSMAYKKALFHTSAITGWNKLKAWFGVGTQKMPENFISGLYRENGQWKLNGKKFTKGDLARMYLRTAKGGFLSNYLQDVGVATGKGMSSNLMTQYLNWRFSEESADSFSYSLGRVINAAVDAGLHGFVEKQSFRDGVFGGIVPIIANPRVSARGIAEGYRSSKGKKWFAKLPKALWSGLSMNSGIYNFLNPTARNKILEAENVRRQKMLTTTQEWLNNKGDSFLSGIGGFLELSKREAEAIKRGDFQEFTESRLGQLVNTAMMFAQLQGKGEHINQAMEYIRQRAARAKVTERDMERLVQLAAEVREKVSQGVDLRTALSEVSDKDKGLVSDLLEIEQYNREVNTKDNRTDIQKLNDLRDNARQMLDMMQTIKAKMRDAAMRFGEDADLVVQEEYAKIAVFRDLLDKRINKLSSLIKKVGAKAMPSLFENTEPSERALSSQSALVLADYGGSMEKLLTGKETLEEAIEEARIELKRLKNQMRETTDSKKWLELKLMQQQLESTRDAAMLQLKRINSVIKEHKRLTPEQQQQSTLITAREMLDLPEDQLYSLLTSKNLSDAQKEEIRKFTEAVEAVNETKDVHGTYTELLQQKLQALRSLKKTDFIESMTEKDFSTFNEQVKKMRDKQAFIYYKGWFSDLADESQYFVNDNGPDSGMLSEQQAYEKFVRTYQEKVDDIRNDRLPGVVERVAALDALDEVLKDNKFFKMYKQRSQASARAIFDISNYVDPTKFTDAEREEISNIIKWATIMKGMDSESLFEELAKADDSTLQQLQEALEEGGDRLGSIEDIRARLQQYNYNITDAISKNKERKANRTSKKEVPQGMQNSETASEQQSFSNVLGILKSYIDADSDSKLSSVRKLLDMLGVKDSGNEMTYTAEVLECFREVVKELENAKEAQEAIDIINKAISDYAQGINGKRRLSGQNLGNLTLAFGMLKKAIANASTKLIPYAHPNGEYSSKETRNTDPGRRSRTYEFADLSWNKENTLQKTLESKRPDEYLKKNKITRDTRMIFITSPKWTQSVKDDMGDRYSDGDAPVFGAVIVENATDTTEEVTILDENGNEKVVNCQILGIMPSQKKQANTSVIRSKIASSKSYSESQPTVITDTDGRPLTTEIENRPSVQMDTEAEPVKIPSNLWGRVVTSDNVMQDSSGKPRVNWTPGTNEKATNTANWAYVYIQDIDKTTNDQGQTVFYVEDAVEYNSRTKGFAEALQAIIKAIANREESLKTLLESMSRLNNFPKAGEGSFINMGVPNKIGTSLREFITLKNGYAFVVITAPGDPNSIVLAVVPTTVKNNVEVVDFTKGARGINGRTNKWVIATADADPGSQSVTPISDIIKELCQLQDKDGETIAKWQVHFGNFNLSKGQQTKAEYIETAQKDGILYARPVLYTPKILISEVQDIAAKEARDLESARREADAAQRAIESSVDPMTGQSINPEDVAQTTESTIDIMKKAKQAEKIIRLQNGLGVIHRNANMAAEIRRDRPKLAVNQHTPRYSATATVESDETVLTKQDYCSFILGSCVDRAVRDFFSPSLRDKMKDYKYFQELFKDVLSEASCKYLFNALERLRDSFAINGWHIISSGVYTVDEAIKTRNGNPKIVGECDLLAYDAFGNVHIIDIKTYGTDRFSDREGKYARQLSQYRDDLMRNTGLFIPKENIHLYALHIDNSKDYYNISTDSQTEVTTITLKDQYADRVQITASTRFELFDSTSPVNPVSYVGEEITQAKIHDRRVKAGVESGPETESFDSPSVQQADSEMPSQNQVQSDTTPVSEGQEREPSQAQPESQPLQIQDLPESWDAGEVIGGKYFRGDKQSEGDDTAFNIRHDGTRGEFVPSSLRSIQSNDNALEIIDTTTDSFRVRDADGMVVVSPGEVTWNSEKNRWDITKNPVVRFTKNGQPMQTESQIENSTPVPESQKTESSQAQPGQQAPTQVQTEGSSSPSVQTEPQTPQPQSENPAQTAPQTQSQTTALSNLANLDANEIYEHMQIVSTTSGNGQVGARVVTNPGENPMYTKWWSGEEFTNIKEGTEWRKSESGHDVLILKAGSRPGEYVAVAFRDNLTDAEKQIVEKVFDINSTPDALVEAIADQIAKFNVTAEANTPVSVDAKQYLKIKEWAQTSWDGTTSAIQRKFGLGQNEADLYAAMLNSDGIKGVNTDRAAERAAEEATQDNFDKTQEELEESEEDTLFEEDMDMADLSELEGIDGTEDLTNENCR